MAKVFGERSRYLIVSDYCGRVGAILMYFLLLFLLYKFFEINIFSKTITIVGFVVSTVLYFPIAYYCVRELERYTLELKNYKQGRNGEYEICDELEKLPEEYLIFQDVKLDSMGNANIDFVVLGPAGIYAIETKSHLGRANLEDGTGKRFLHQTMNGALHLHDYILQTTGKDFFVNPVLVFSRADVRFGLRPVNKVYVIGKTYLEKLILSGEKSLSENDILLVRDVLLKVVKGQKC